MDDGMFGVGILLSGIFHLSSRLFCFSECESFFFLVFRLPPSVCMAHTFFDDPTAFLFFYVMFTVNEIPLGFIKSLQV